MRYITALFIFGLLAYLPVRGQIEYPGKPLGMVEYDTAIPFINLQSAREIQQISRQRSDKADLEFKSDQFGESVDIRLDPKQCGRWLKHDENLIVWQVGFTSDQASSLGLIFSPLYLERGAKLFVYTPDGSVTRGAFTFRNNKDSKVFAITPLPGDSLVIELQVYGRMIDFGELVINRMGIGFPVENWRANEKDGWYGWSAECEVDINCTFERNIQRQKYAVCRVLYNNTNRCTGTLLNNTTEDGTPLVITGGHCIRNESDAQSAIFAFDYESPYCGGPDGTIKSVSGSSLMSRSSSLDFTLVQLSETPPVNYYPVYSGWDATGKVAGYTYVPHHPEGDVKKISIDHDSLLSASFLDYDPGTHWLIADYELGTTERGSSGAPLFDSANRLIGTLSGGGEVCSEHIYDYYQKFSHCWGDYPDAGEQLKAWLDPTHSGITTLDNFYPVDPALAYIEELSNIGPGEQIAKVTCSDDYGWIAGHNASNTADYVEHFFVNGSKYLYAVRMDIARVSFTDPQAKFTLKIWEGNNEAKEVVHQKDIYLFEIDPDTVNYIHLDTMILVNGNFYVGYEIYYQNPPDTFAVKTVPDDNLREMNSAYKWVNSNSSSYPDGNWEPLSCGNEPVNTSLAIFPLVFNYYFSNDTDHANYPENQVTLYPNPTYESVQILFRTQPDGRVTVRVYNLNGQLIDIRAAESPEPNIRLDISALVRGIYIVKIECSEGTFYRKLLIL
jgi:hypothetical protein